MDIPAQLTALQAKIVGRLLEPERVPWKAYFSGWLAMPLTAEQRAAVPAQSQHLWQLGTGLPFSSFFFFLGRRAFFFLFFFLVWKKAYMSIDANLVSNPKDR